MAWGSQDGSGRPSGTSGPVRWPCVPDPLQAHRGTSPSVDRVIPARLQPVLDEVRPLADAFAAAGHPLYLVGGIVRDLHAKPDREAKARPRVFAISHIHGDEYHGVEGLAFAEVHLQPLGGIGVGGKVTVPADAFALL